VLSKHRTISRNGPKPANLLGDRWLRHQRKLFQEQLAHDAEVDRAYMSRVERAVTYVGLEIIGKLATILEVDPAEFFRRSPPAFTPD
jgi:transcriptional regulator with XRE-family HTH domain